MLPGILSITVPEIATFAGAFYSVSSITFFIIYEFNYPK